MQSQMNNSIQESIRNLHYFTYYAILKENLSRTKKVSISILKPLQKRIINLSPTLLFDCRHQQVAAQLSSLD